MPNAVLSLSCIAPSLDLDIARCSLSAIMSLSAFDSAASAWMMLASVFFSCASACSFRPFWSFAPADERESAFSASASSARRPSSSFAQPSFVEPNAALDALSSDTLSCRAATSRSSRCTSSLASLSLAVFSAASEPDEAAPSFFASDSSASTFFLSDLISASFCPIWSPTSFAPFAASAIRFSHSETLAAELPILTSIALSSLPISSSFLLMPDIAPLLSLRTFVSPCLSSDSAAALPESDDSSASADFLLAASASASFEYASRACCTATPRLLSTL